MLMLIFAILFVVVLVPLLFKGFLYLLFTPFVAAYNAFKHLKSESRKERFIGRLVFIVFGLLALAIDKERLIGRLFFIVFGLLALAIGFVILINSLN